MEAEGGWADHVNSKKKIKINNKKMMAPKREREREREGGGGEGRGDGGKNSLITV